MDECFGFAIEDNEFEEQVMSGSYFGIWVSNTRAQNEIYRNDFKEFNYANLAIGQKLVANDIY